MKKILTLAAAALFASAASAMATQITFKGFCDGMQLQTADGVNFTSTETGACLQGTSVTGGGKAIRGHLRLRVNWEGFTGKADTKRYVLHFPLKTGGKFKEYVLKKGNWVLLNSGKYTVQE
jgi:hypothetical protein